jgi:hypothetical protein
MYGVIYSGVFYNSYKILLYLLGANGEISPVETEILSAASFGYLVLFFYSECSLRSTPSTPLRTSAL